MRVSGSGFNVLGLRLRVGVQGSMIEGRSALSVWGIGT